MFDDIHAYFYENVLETYREYEEVRSSRTSGSKKLLRVTVDMATTLFHLREHLPDSLRKSKNVLSQECPDYGLIGDIANVSKHKTISRNNPRITNAENIYDAVVVTEYQDNRGPYRNAVNSVFAKLDDGTIVDLHSIIVNVLNMWLRELERIEIINHVEPFSSYPKYLPKRSEASEEANITSIMGVRIRQTFLLQKYNYETKTLEPIDLSECHITGGVYKREYNCTLRAKHKDNGPDIEIDLTLDGNQYDAMQRIDTDEQKMVFLLQIAVEQGKLTKSTEPNRLKK